MKLFKNTSLYTAMFSAAIALGGIASAHAQPMMGDAPFAHEGAKHGHEHMEKYWEKKQAELKTKLHLNSSQEPAWQQFVTSMKMPEKATVTFPDRDAMARLNTPERIYKMNALHDQNLSMMQTHRQQRDAAIKQLYAQLSPEQQKTFDAETLPQHPHHGHSGKPH